MELYICLPLEKKGAGKWQKAKDTVPLAGRNQHRKFSKIKIEMDACTGSNTISILFGPYGHTN